MDNFQNFQTHYYKKNQYKIKDALLQRKKYEKRSNQVQTRRSKLENHRFGREIKDLNNLTEISNQTNSQICKFGDILSKINKDPEEYTYKDNMNLEYKIPSINKITKSKKPSNLIKVNMKKPIINITTNNNYYYKNIRHSSITTKNNKYISILQDKNNYNTLRDSSRSRKMYRNSVVFKKIRKNSIIKIDDSRNNISFSNSNNNYLINNDKINNNKYKASGKENDFNSINLINNNIIKNYNYLKYDKRTNNENIDISNNIKFSNSKNNNRESLIMRFIRKQYNLPKEKESNKILNLSLNYRHKSKNKDKEADNNNYQRKSHINMPKRCDNIGLIPINKKSSERFNYKQNSIPIIYPRNINPQIPIEYLPDIYKYLKSIENIDLPLRNYMDIIQNDINEKMRTILLDWLVEVHIKFNLLSETLFITINLIDRFLSKKSIHRKYLQLLGITALLIACKYEEIYPPEIKQLILMTDNAYIKDQVFKMENEILRVVKFNISFPTSLKFLELFGNKLNLSEKNFYRCLYFIEVSLIDYNSSFFNPSLIAATSLYFNYLNKNKVNELGYDEKTIFNITGYNKKNINECLYYLNNAIKNIEMIGSKYNAVRRKFKLDKYLNIAYKKYFIENNLEL